MTVGNVTVVARSTPNYLPQRGFPWCLVVTGPIPARVDVAFNYHDRNTVEVSINGTQKTFR